AGLESLGRLDEVVAVGGAGDGGAVQQPLPGERPDSRSQRSQRHVRTWGDSLACWLNTKLRRINHGQKRRSACDTEASAAHNHAITSGVGVLRRMTEREGGGVGARNRVAVE